MEHMHRYRIEQRHVWIRSFRRAILIDTYSRVRLYYTVTACVVGHDDADEMLFVCIDQLCDRIPFDLRLPDDLFDGVLPIK